ncbi:unnamed protein product [Durusdinium trenchii]|uniref:Copia protein n=2 Tax=Durusdinium trenchii TaxID=1381693 RepID=A0ABP0N4H3_9DINO
MMRAMITVVFGAQLAQLASTKQELWPELNELLDASVQECAVESTCLKRWLFASCSLSRCASSSKPKLQESVALVGDSGLKNAWEELMMLLRQQVPVAAIDFEAKTPHMTWAYGCCQDDQRTETETSRARGSTRRLRAFESALEAFQFSPLEIRFHDLVLCSHRGGEPGAASPAVFLALAPDKTSQEALFRSLRPFEKELEGPKEQREGLFHMTLMQVRHWNSTIHSAVNELWSQHNAKLGAIRLEKANLKREGPPLAGQ